MHLFCWVYQLELKVTLSFPEEFLVCVFNIWQKQQKQSLLTELNILITPLSHLHPSFCSCSHCTEFQFSQPLYVTCISTDSNCKCKCLACLQNPNHSNSAYTDALYIFIGLSFPIFTTHSIFLRTHLSFLFLFSVATSSWLLFFPSVSLVIFSS